MHPLSQCLRSTTAKVSRAPAAASIDNTVSEYRKAAQRKREETEAGIAAELERRQRELEQRQREFDREAQRERDEELMREVINVWLANSQELGNWLPAAAVHSEQVILSSILHMCVSNV